MKKHLTLLTVALFGASSFAFAADGHSHGQGAKAKPAAKADADVIAKARATYPLKTCLVSDEALGSMGEAVGYIHRAAGKPERVIFVCCEGCIDDFKAEPAKYLKKVDDAAKAKGASGKKTSSAKGGHGEHKHE
jgi:hypothetical protein